MTKKMLFFVLVLFIFQGVAHASSITLKSVRKNSVILYDNHRNKLDIIEGEKLKQFKNRVLAGRVSVIESKPPYLHIQIGPGESFWVKRNDFITTKTSKVSINKEAIGAITDRNPGSGSMGADEL